jgi:rhodanese-related sulfurtransferase/DNA-binding transcriptional ArsR family regulator
MNSRVRQFHTQLYGHYARIGKALASPVRVEILDVLAQGPRTVEVLAREVGGTVANVSRNLQVLLSARMVTGTREGLFVRYGLAGDEVAEFLARFRELARLRLAEVDQVARTFFGTANAEDIEEVDRAELLRRVDAGEVTVVDVRPGEEYEAGHLPGAVSIPLEALRERLESFPKDREIVAYCRGPHCVLAVEAVEWLRQQGYRARRLDLGVHDWQKRGFALEFGANDGRATGKERAG